MTGLIGFDISGYGIFQAFVLGVLLFLLLKVLRKVLSLILFPTTYRAMIVRLFPAAGICAWLAFAYWAVRAIILNKSYAALAWTGILLIAFIWFSWFALRDYFAGVILKIHDNYEEGQRFKVGTVEGTIKKRRLLDIEIEQENGDSVYIPYSRISGEVHWKNAAYEGPHYHKFVLRIRKKMSVDSIIERLRLCIFSSPWAATNKEPQIKLLNQTEDSVDCEVCVYALNNDYFHVLERDVRNQMFEWKDESGL
jgi:hypothetical protein